MSGEIKVQEILKVGKNINMHEIRSYDSCIFWKNIITKMV